MKKGGVVVCILLLLVSTVSAGSFFQGSVWDEWFSGNAASDTVSDGGSFADITGNFIGGFLQLFGFATSTSKVVCNDKAFPLSIGESKDVCGGKVMVQLVKITAAKGKTPRTIHILVNGKRVPLAQGVMATVKKVKTVGTLYALALPTKKEGTIQLQLLSAKPTKGYACGKKTDCQVGLECTNNVCVAPTAPTPGTKGIGARCVKNTECSSGNCVNRKCA